jgi:putative ABC transport system substrate-binding protein
MKRREFISLLGGAAAAWPFAARGQPSGLRRIGVLMAYFEDDAEAKKWIAAFSRGLAARGWKDGSNLTIEYRWAGDSSERIRAMAAELVEHRPEVLLASSTLATGALLQSTRTTPIVFANVSDPIGSGFVANLARPGGNATGFIPIEPALGGKWVSLLKEVVPGIGRVAFLYDPATAPFADGFIRHAQTAATSDGMQCIATPLRDVDEIEPNIAVCAREPGGSMIVLSSPFTTAHRGRIIAAAAQYGLPAIYGFRYFVVDGGLMSYGNDMNYMYLSAASYVDRILKGEKPADLPTQTPTKFELVINLKTAKALDLTIPETFLARADVVIE